MMFSPKSGSTDRLHEFPVLTSTPNLKRIQSVNDKTQGSLVNSGLQLKKKQKQKKTKKTIIHPPEI